MFEGLVFCLGRGLQLTCIAAGFVRDSAGWGTMAWSLGSASRPVFVRIYIANSRVPGLLSVVTAIPVVRVPSPYIHPMTGKLTQAVGYLHRRENQKSRL